VERRGPASSRDRVRIAIPGPAIFTEKPGILAAENLFFVFISFVFNLEMSLLPENGTCGMYSWLVEASFSRTFLSLFLPGNSARICW
jgi:hypothetical protein